MRAAVAEVVERWTTILYMPVQVLQSLNRLRTTVCIKLRIRDWHVVVLNWMKLKCVQFGSLWQFIGSDVDSGMSFKTFPSPSEIFHNVQEIVAFLIWGKLVRLKVSLEGIHGHASRKIYSHPCVTPQMIHSHQNRVQSILVKIGVMKFRRIWKCKQFERLGISRNIWSDDYSIQSSSPLTIPKAGERIAALQCSLDGPWIPLEGKVLLAYGCSIRQWPPHKWWSSQPSKKLFGSTLVVKVHVAPWHSQEPCRARKPPNELQGTAPSLRNSRATPSVHLIHSSWNVHAFFSVFFWGTVADKCAKTSSGLDFKPWPWHPRWRGLTEVNLRRQNAAWSPCPSGRLVGFVLFGVHWLMRSSATSYPTCHENFPLQSWHLLALSIDC